MPNDFGTPGVAEHGFTLGKWEDAIRLKRHIEDVVRRGSEGHDPAKRKALLSIVICWFRVLPGQKQSVNCMTEATHWQNSTNLIQNEIQFSFDGKWSDHYEIMLDRSDADKAERYMEKRGIRSVKNTGVVGVHEEPC